ncbi:MAG: tripartite tricarboxylate transporter substrate binding protein [Betaproteobacteria bacterium]|nr:tripartite tricarboxylate transporter substrate binding protein [Betaproteobacteria bacterium]
MSLSHAVIGMFVVGMTLFNSGPASSQNYPSRPIRLVTSEPGGGTDFAARTIALGIAGPLGQLVIVDNRGGGSNIAGEIVTRATADGHTLLVTGGSFWVGPLFRKTTYDPIKGFSPISLLVKSPNILVVNPSVAANSVGDLVALARAKPGALNYASGGIGTSSHLAAELFKYMAGVDIVHIPYKGSGAVNINLIGGQVQLTFATVASVASHIKAGRLKALAVTSAKPSTLVPDLPTVAATVPGYDTGGATAMFASPGTPAAIVSRLNREVVRLLNQADVREKFFNVGVETVGSSPEQLAATVKSEMARLGKVVKDAGIRVD